MLDHHCIILAENWPWPHCSDRIFSIVAWWQPKLVLEYSKKIVWGWVAEFFWKLVYWQKIKAKIKSWCADNRKLIIATLNMQKFFLQKFFFLKENIGKFIPLLYAIGIFKENCMKSSGRIFFGNWYIDRKLKQKWNHGVLTTEN